MMKGAIIAKISNESSSFCPSYNALALNILNLYASFPKTPRNMSPNIKDTD